ncbi:MAG: hypothetical protein QF664_13380 [Dehalococcoidia bacterium]|jgi:hypothetical protein|nr:hypothetical protein [Dehalococcoidia bacterium]
MSVEGSWALKISSPMGEQPATLELKGSDSLTGSMNASVGNSELTGSLDGDAIEFKGEMDSQMGKIELTFTGTVDGDEMSGSAQFGSFGSGGWTATRS